MGNALAEVEASPSPSPTDTGTEPDVTPEPTETLEPSPTPEPPRETGDSKTLSIIRNVLIIGIVALVIVRLVIRQIKKRKE